MNVTESNFRFENYFLVRLCYKMCLGSSTRKLLRFSGTKPAGDTAGLLLKKHSFLLSAAPQGVVFRVGDSSTRSCRLRTISRTAYIVKVLTTTNPPAPENGSVGPRKVCKVPPRTTPLPGGSSSPATGDAQDGAVRTGKSRPARLFAPPSLPAARTRLASIPRPF